MSTSKSSNSVNLSSWQPPNWDWIPGNYRVKKYFMRLARRLRRQIAQGSALVLNHMCFLLTGMSRTGKTASVKLLIRCIVCHRLDEATLTPCDGTCPGCRPLFENVPEGEWELFTFLNTPTSRTPIHFFLINCAKIYTPKELLEKLICIAQNAGTGYIIVYLDEVHRLVQRQMDELLLKEVEEARYLWFFSTAKPGRLEDMFQNRLIKLSTEVPSTTEMEKLLVDLCNLADINWEPEAIMRLIEKSNRIVGLALQALVLASLDPEEGLTLDLVENDWTVKLEE